MQKPDFIRLLDQQLLAGDKPLEQWCNEVAALLAPMTDRYPTITWAEKTPDFDRVRQALLKQPHKIASLAVEANVPEHVLRQTVIPQMRAHEPDFSESKLKAERGSKPATWFRIGSLPWPGATQREVSHKIMRVLHGESLNVAEIAQRTGVPIGQVRWAIASNLDHWAHRVKGVRGVVVTLGKPPEDVKEPMRLCKIGGVVPY